MRELQFDAATRTEQRNQHQNSGQTLRNNRSKRNAANTHVENKDENEVQNNIHQSGNKKKIEGTFGISDCTKNTGAHIIAVP